MGLKDIIAAFKQNPEEPDPKLKDKVEESPLVEPGLVSRIEAFAAKGGHHAPRAPGFHCSEMFNFCGRLSILDRFFPENIVPGAKQPSAQLQMIFDVGHALHHWFQNQYLGPAGILKGKWLCLGCGHHMPGFMPQRCEKCKAEQWRLQYLEPIVEETSLNLVGHSDGIVELEGEEVVLEIKTINPNSFATLKSPLPSHVFQINIYMHLLKKKRGIILYINKASSELMEFNIEYDRAVWNDVESKLGSILRFERHVSKSGGKVDAAWITQVQGICSYRECRSAQGCHQVGPCFELREKRGFIQLPPKSS